MWQNVIHCLNQCGNHIHCLNLVFCTSPYLCINLIAMNSKVYRVYKGKVFHTGSIAGGAQNT